MQYFVVWPDGQKFGPADIDLINQWISEGRINADTLLEAVDGGAQIKAGAVPGLNFPVAQEAPPAEVAPISAPEAPSPAPASPEPARYFVVMPDGAKYGPADVPTLNQWLSEGRVNAQSNVQEEATGETMPLGSVPGVIAAASAVKQPEYPQPQQPTYQQPNVPYPRLDPVAQSGDGGKSSFTMSIVFSLIGFLCCPVVFSSLGIYFGTKAKGMGHAKGQVAVIFGVVSLVVGIILSAIVNGPMVSNIINRAK